MQTREPQLVVILVPEHLLDNVTPGRHLALVCRQRHELPGFSSPVSEDGGHLDVPELVDEGQGVKVKVDDEQPLEEGADLTELQLLMKGEEKRKNICHEVHRL